MDKRQGRKCSGCLFLWKMDALTEKIPYIIRQADIKDIPFIVSLRMKLFRSFLQEDSYDFEKIAEFENNYFKNEMEKNQFAAWVAESDKGEAVGCAAVSFYGLPPKPWNLKGRYAYISGMYVEPEHQRKGIGKRLLQRALDYATEQGASHVTLHTTEKGILLYQSLGFGNSNEMRLELFREDQK